MKRLTMFLLAMLVVSAAQTVAANEVEIVAATIKSAGSTYTVNVTLEHKDEGWQHYANLWEVWTADGKTLLGKRVLAHPHVNEQPFTRSLSRVEVPAGAARVMIRAYDLVHGESPETLLVDMPKQ